MSDKLISKQDGKAIVDAIKEAESHTSGEIRLHIENHCKQDVLDRAAEVFSVLNMHKTKLRNGVLIYMALKDKKFAIIGDAGINQKLDDHYWGDIKEHMVSRFKSGSIIMGLCEGIGMVGQKLKEKYPAAANDKNEITDEISFGNN